MAMKVTCLFAGIRSACFQIEDSGLFYASKVYSVTLNGESFGEVNTCVFSIYRLTPGTAYTLALDGEEILTFSTQNETYTLDIRRFGAIGDGAHDDTAAIQAAISCCPENGRVLIPAGDWLTGPLFLKSRTRVELRKDATLHLSADRKHFPILPGLIQSTDEKENLSLGSWEGNPLDTFASLLTGAYCEDVVIYGEGTIDGSAAQSDWWVEHRTKRGAWRPRMVFLNRCRNITLQGLTVQNSPCWNLHP